MVEVYRRLETQLEATKEKMGQYYDRKRRPAPQYKVGDLVMLNGSNIRTKRQCRKLDDKMYGPFKIIKVGGNKRWCRLELPPTWKIHPAFNVALLEPYRGDPLEREVPPIEVDDGGWTPESIVASGPTDNDHRKHVFLVKWSGYSHDENTWESWEHLNDVAPELITEYYTKNPAMEKDSRWRSQGKKSLVRKRRKL
jgi:hypothetical protein